MWSTELWQRSIQCLAASKLQHVIGDRGALWTSFGSPFNLDVWHCHVLCPNTQLVNLSLIPLERDGDCDPDAGVIAVVQVIPIVGVIKIYVVGFVPVGGHESGHGSTNVTQ